MLAPNDIYEIPAMRAAVARAAFPKGNAVMTIRDELGSLFEDVDFAALYPPMGQPAESPARLALVTILQFMENLTDREAADAVRSRIELEGILTPACFATAWTRGMHLDLMTTAEAVLAELARDSSSGSNPFPS